MSLTSVQHQFVEAHALCNYCSTTCDSSIIIQTYLKYGNEENNAALRQRCVESKQSEEFEHCSITEFQAGYQNGCHLCTMLWRFSMGEGDTQVRLLQEREDFEKENGTSKSILKVAIYGNTVAITLCTRYKGTSHGGISLHGYLVRDFQGTPTLTFFAYLC